MNRFLTMSLLVALICAALAPAGASASTKCGDLSTVIAFNITATRISCTTARTVAYDFAKRRDCYQKGCRVGGFRCTRKQTGYESYTASCRRRSARVRFGYGA